MFKRILIFILILAIPVTAWAVKYKGDLEPDESVTFPEQSSQPASPPSGKRKLYFKDDGSPYSLDSSGNESPIVGTGLKNYIINGNFDLWQRGTSFVNPGGATYGADRWRMHLGTGNTVTYSQQAFALGQTDVPGEPEFFIRIDKTAGAGAGPELRQFIESVRTLAGQTVTLSFYAKADSARTLGVVLTQNFGTGGTPSGSVGHSAGSHSLTTSWQKFTHTLTLSSISGKTLGTNGNDTLELKFAWSTNANGQTDIAQVQLEKGSVATEFEKRPFGIEEILAQRYYQTAGFNIFGEAISTTVVGFHVDFPVQMRAAPSLTLLDTTPFIEVLTVGTQTGSSSALTTTRVGTQGGDFGMNGFTGMTVGKMIQMGEEEVVGFDSEF